MYSSAMSYEPNEPLPDLGSLQTPVASIYYKIESLLPYKSGYSIAQLEGDNFFRATRQTLFKFGRTQLLNEILICTIRILDNINAHDHQTTLDDKSTASLKSINIIVELLASILSDVWDELEHNHAEYNIYKKMGLTFPQSIMNGKVYRTVQPRPIPSNIYRHLLSILGKMKTDSDMVKQVRKLGLYPMQSLSKRASASSATEKGSIISSIDENILLVVRYLAASDPNDFFRYIEFKVKVQNMEMMFIPRSDFIGEAFITSGTISAYLHLVKDFNQVTRKTSQQCMLFTYLSDAIYNWALCRTRDYLIASEDPNVVKDVELLFEFIFRLVDYKIPSCFKILSTIMLLMPQQFEKHMNDKTSKSPIAFKRLSSKGSKQKFLTDLTTIIPRVPTCGENLLKIMMVGATVKIVRGNGDHPISKFANDMFIPVRKDLSMGNLDFFPHNSDARTTTLMRSYFYAIASVLYTKPMIQVCTDLFGNPTTPIAHLIPLSGGIVKLLEVPSLADALFDFTYVISLDMKVVMHRLAHSISGPLYENDTDSNQSTHSTNSLMDLMDVLKVPTAGKPTSIATSVITATTVSQARPASVVSGSGDLNIGTMRSNIAPSMKSASLISTGGSLSTPSSNVSHLNGNGYVNKLDSITPIPSSTSHVSTDQQSVTSSSSTGRVQTQQF
ncbi:unnamed protein product [Ambrosiozyma monospora]|uniref:Unnamed protein product n=1 Tax=Ambrosiozyma monospora TaxID=43982 RepID=A0ACB5SYA9_AMBMO|nr:unnamed protein product [Ambrosiozyma monospora]